MSSETKQYSVFNITLPTAWTQLDDRQLKFIYSRLGGGLAPAQARFFFFLYVTKSKVIRGAAPEGKIPLRIQGLSIIFENWEIDAALQALDWLYEPSTSPVRVSRVRGVEARAADLSDLTFEEYLMLENLYIGFLHSKDNKLLKRMEDILYPRPRRMRSGKFSEWRQINVIMWYTSFKNWCASRWPVFFQKASGSLPSRKQLQDSMDVQLRALTKGDITKEESIRKMPCLRAVTELAAMAREAEELKRQTRH